MLMPNAIDDPVDGACVSMILRVDGLFLCEVWSHANMGEIFGKAQTTGKNSFSVVE